MSVIHVLTPRFKHAPTPPSPEASGRPDHGAQPTARPLPDVVRGWVTKYRTLHESSPDALVVAEIDAEGRDLGFVDCNQAALDLLGMTRPQLLAASTASLSPERQPDGRPSLKTIGELIARCLARGSLRFDWVHCRANGDAFPVEITMIVYRERGRTFVHSVWRDLTGLPPTGSPEGPAQTK